MLDFEMENLPQKRAYYAWIPNWAPIKLWNSSSDLEESNPRICDSKPDAQQLKYPLKVEHWQNVWTENNKHNSLPVMLMLLRL